MIDPEGPVPLYQQVAEVLRARIADGTYPPNRPIPSIPHLMQEFGVARGTVMRAVEILIQGGLVHVVQGRGTYVTSRSQ